MAENTGTGKLQVRVTTGNGAFPLKDAIVTVSARDGFEAGTGALYNLRTDESGLTATVDLPAPARNLSMSPRSGTSALPYSLYDVKVFREGYGRTENIGVQIFDGIKATQTVDLMPNLPSDGEFPDNGTRLFETPQNNL